MDQITPGEVTECHQYTVWRKDDKVLSSWNALASNYLLICCYVAQNWF